MNAPHDEAAAVAARYAQRIDDGRYDPLRPEVMLARQERERTLIGLLRRHLCKPLRDLDLLEVGCGSGDNLLELLRLGVDPARLVGNELLPERVAAARARLPAASVVHAGDATALPFDAACFDLVLQVTVFSSLLDDAFQQRLADRMWHWLRPGGAVLWYDFTWDNPRNRRRARRADGAGAGAVPAGDNRRPPRHAGAAARPPRRGAAPGAVARLQPAAAAAHAPAGLDRQTRVIPA